MMYSPRNILIVEDDVAVGELICEVIDSETTYQSVWLTTIRAAIEQAPQLQPLLFILNYSLPDGNGIELYDTLHAIPVLQNVPALMISATPSYDELKKRGIRGLAKPFDVEMLLEAIQGLVLPQGNGVDLVSSSEQVVE